MILIWILVGLVVSMAWNIIWGTGRLLVGLLFGVIGAGLGGFLAMMLGLGALMMFGVPNILMAVGGACLFMGLNRMIRTA